MQQITSEQFIDFLEKKDQRFAVVIQYGFYYVEQGRIYRFESNHNDKALQALQAFYGGEMDSSSLEEEIKKIIIKQMQYDWFTDVWKEDINEKVMRSGNNLEAFFF
ncbi:hypothetical protein JZO66_00090 [Enterococcus sp. DIV0242_7C1]|uniref:Uncharacterized protein n=1 Tax=Candidatus Enterococcus dunnyi TaxID=1834192 RepID=A0A200JGR3_9ENTE|nr:MULTISPECIES: hypothetical protein [unclassified Enterococcus]MBO0468924.1 hypothetical protein [Enterococcus sp. DIV0242_7C1]OUZ35787.1 hypothetical protein A5889_001263 [Enterococcus sp. 9D6_DIV0238]